MEDLLQILEMTIEQFRQMIKEKIPDMSGPHGDPHSNMFDASPKDEDNGHHRRETRGADEVILVFLLNKLIFCRIRTLILTHY